MYSRGSAAEWDTALSSLRAQGGSLVLAFGNAPVRVDNMSAARTDPRFADCVLPGGEHCLDVTLAAIAARGAKVGVVLTLAVETQYSPAIMTPCAGAVPAVGELHLPPLDNATRMNEYWVAVLPRNDSAVAAAATAADGATAAVDEEGEHGHGDTCSLRVGGVVDVVMMVLPNAMYTPSPADALRTRVEAAARNGVELLLPMVALPARSDAPWSVDNVALPAFLQLASREARDTTTRFHGAERRAIRGVYQSHEMVLANTSGWLTEYGYYDATARAVHSVDPTLAVVVSPYWIVNRDDPSAQSPQDTVAGIAALARTDLDAVAPQEGRGTGKCGCFTADEASHRIADVDPNLARYSNINATATFAEQFSASTTQLYAGARTAVDAANAERGDGRNVELWMNLEAFEQTHVNPCDVLSGTDRTNASRVVRSWELVKNSTASIDKLISYMWDPFFTCVPKGYNSSLHEELLAQAH
jgi:hypothetical protein